MSTYVIGDIQGCFATLEHLLETIEFDPDRDRLWLVGDLVNRGPRSLSVLRWAEGLGDTVTAVLGNHDLHLLAVAAGVRRQRAGDTLGAILQAPDRDQLLDWLTRRPFFHREGRTALVHAGLLPFWSWEEAQRLSDEAGEALRERPQELLAKKFGKRVPGDADAGLLEAIDAFTRLRVTTADGRMCLDHKGSPADAPPGCRPWFDLWNPERGGDRVFFGHWAVLGLHRGTKAIGLDSGCVWGGELSAYRLEDDCLLQVPHRD